MKKTVSLRFLVTLVCFFTAAAVAVTTMLFTFVIVPKREGALFDHNQKMLEIRDLVERYYTGELDEEYVRECLAMGYVAGLNDKYADYITPDMAEESMNQLYGLNTGIGVQVTAHPDNMSILVLEVHRDSLAHKAGVQPKDEIIRLDGQNVSELGYSESLAYIKSIPLGNKMKTVLLRDGKEIEMELELTQFVTQSVFYRVIDNVGYVQITTFNDSSVDQFTDAIDDLVKQNVEGIIFDLRGNGGGTLLSVYHMVDYLIPEGLAIEVKYKDPANSQTYLSGPEDVDIPMVVLTDESTASASELFTQALKDYDKAISIGRTTYGKGVVQRTFSLSDGSLVRFTVAKYYTANGTCLDGIGVIPEIKTEWTEEELRYRLLKGIEVDKDFLKAMEHLKTQKS